MFCHQEKEMIKENMQRNGGRFKLKRKIEQTSQDYPCNKSFDTKYVAIYNALVIILVVYIILIGGIDNSILL